MVDPLHCRKLLPDGNGKGNIEPEAVYRTCVQSNSHRAYVYPHFFTSGLRHQEKVCTRYRNPVIYARELLDEITREGLSRKQLAERHGVTFDRITQWLCLLKLPEEAQKRIIALGDKLAPMQVVKDSLELIEGRMILA